MKNKKNKVKTKLQEEHLNLKLYFDKLPLSN